MNNERTPLTATVVDDNDLAVAGLESLLATYTERVRLVDVRTALAHPEEVDVVLYEPMQQSSFSASMLRNLQSAAEAQAIVFSWAPADQLPDTTSPYLSKSMTAAQLVVALEDIVSGRGVPAPPVHTPAEKVEPVAPIRTPQAPAGSRLTPRELEILTLITQGLTNGEIGEELGLSINSIKTYIRQAYRKIDVERRTQAVAWGMANGLLPDAEPVAVGPAPPHVLPGALASVGRTPRPEPLAPRPPRGVRRPGLRSFPGRGWPAGWVGDRRGTARGPVCALVTTSCVAKGWLTFLSALRSRPSGQDLPRRDLE